MTQKLLFPTEKVIFVSKIFSDQEKKILSNLKKTFRLKNIIFRLTHSKKIFDTKIYLTQDNALIWLT